MASLTTQGPKETTAAIFLANRHLDRPWRLALDGPGEAQTLSWAPMLRLH